MIEMPASELAIQQLQRMLDAAANGGKLQCINQQGGSKIFYIKQPLRANEDFLTKVLYGKPGPGPTAPVLRLIVDNSAGARAHVEARLPGLMASHSVRAR